MSNARNGNTYYVDTANEKLSTSDNIKVCFLILSKTSASSGTFQLKDGSASGDVKLTVEIPGQDVVTIDFVFKLFVLHNFLDKIS